MSPTCLAMKLRLAKYCADGFLCASMENGILCCPTVRRSVPTGFSLTHASFIFICDSSHRSTSSLYSDRRVTTPFTDRRAFLTSKRDASISGWYSYFPRSMP